MFYCKQSLYKTIAAEASGLIVSGTNSDDLTDYRPGLIAAERHSVRHPFAELGVDKKEIRNIARRLGFGSLSEIPASPCLSSRVETGIPVSPLVLAAIYEAEQFLKTKVYSSAIRCRYRKSGISVEVDVESIPMLDPNRKMELLKNVEDIFKKHQIPFTEVNLSPYRMGSAFLVRL